MAFPYAAWRFVWLLLGLVAVATAGVIGWFWFPHPPADPHPEPKRFRECATEAGITWRMTFLRNEQGETFKINLYDHGSGVAIGDFDGDTHFTNADMQGLLSLLGSGGGSVAVPEPGSLLLMALGAAFTTVGARRRSRRPM